MPYGLEKAMPGENPQPFTDWVYLPTHSRLGSQHKLDLKSQGPLWLICCRFIRLKVIFFIYTHFFQLIVVLQDTLELLRQLPLWYRGFIKLFCAVKLYNTKVFQCN